MSKQNKHNILSNHNLAKAGVVLALGGLATPSFLRAERSGAPSQKSPIVSIGEGLGGRQGYTAKVEWPGNLPKDNPR